MTRLLISGANRGIGLELVRARLAQGDHVIACARLPEEADALQALKHTASDRLVILPLDVADAPSVFDLGASLGDRPIDVLVNNAGIIGPQAQATLDMDFDGWAHTLAINTLGPLRVTQALLPNLRHGEKPRILIVSSQMGSMASHASDRLAYRSSKAAVNKVAQALATDLKPMGIAVAAIHPGWVRTRMGGQGAPLDPAESAAGISVLIDRLDLSRTGQFLNVDGAPLAW
ncbi:SDR family oxidoreductase [Rhizobiales bacterium TNE-4]|nr:SDR family oxidoreductase [Rhizobiales bacterium TNE-4]MBV1828207.1 SDR family oxidoreductase [Rhizobiales bacterium TNE-4]